MNQHRYWNTRFQAEGLIWTSSPCQSALIAGERFKAYDIQSVIVPGSGYGRNAKHFADLGYEVTGIEIAERAIEIAREQKIRMRCIHASLLDLPTDVGRYDALFCFNVLHLFLEPDRRRVVEHCEHLLQEHGYGFVVVLSDLEGSYGIGKRLEPDTYESRPGKTVHYFSDSDLRAHFPQFDILESGIVHEPESRGGDATHPCRYIFFQKHGSEHKSAKKNSVKKILTGEGGLL